jgi:hypothetical protein
MRTVYINRQHDLEWECPQKTRTWQEYRKLLVQVLALSQDASWANYKSFLAYFAN